jgi:hypothetical protein
MAHQFNPSPREAVGREDVGGLRPPFLEPKTPMLRIGYGEAKARVGGLCRGNTPHPDARFTRVDPPHHSLRSWGEG